MLFPGGQGNTEPGRQEHHREREHREMTKRETPHKELEGNQNGKPWTTRPVHNPDDKYCDCVDCYRWRAAHCMTWAGAPFEEATIDTQREGA